MKYKKNRYILLIFFFFLFVFGCSKSEKEANEHFQKARKYKKELDFNKAIDEYRTIIYYYPKSLLISKSKKLVEDCEQELEVDKILGIANSLIEEKHFQAALFILKNLIDKHPDSYLSEDIRKKINMLTDNRAQDMLNIARNYKEKGNFEAAIETYKKFIQEFPYFNEIEQVKISLKESENSLKQLNAQKEKEKEKEQRQAEEAKKHADEEKAKQEKLKKEQTKLSNEQKKNNALKALIEKTK
ncbi:tetratricopeptide repeat protein [Candidatus Desantisbacteria bacterium]|nr:tetratricopeptide repeat protein [Candidatus Desantisbacteria bacterium]